MNICPSCLGSAQKGPGLLCKEFGFDTIHRDKVSKALIQRVICRENCYPP